MTRHQIRTYLAVAQWQRANHLRRSYRLFELMRVFRVDATTLALTLRLHNWTRDSLRITQQNRRQLQTWWVPPNARRMDRRRRGRPSFF